MRSRHVEELLNPGLYQVFLMQCPATLPFSFAAHTWLVANQKGIVTRCGVSWRTKRDDGKPCFGNHVCGDGCKGHLHMDAKTPSLGTDMFPFAKSRSWRGHAIGMIEGEEGSLAEHMTEFVTRSFHEYPHADRYRLTGPNSNTYPAWVLAHFPESGLRMPWNAIGKGYASGLESSSTASARS